MKYLLYIAVVTLLYIHIAPQVVKYYTAKEFSINNGCDLGSRFDWDTLRYSFWVPNCTFYHNY